MSATGTGLGDASLQPSQTASADEHDRRQKAKAEAANDGASGEGGDDGPDIFSHAGVAAE